MSDAQDILDNTRSWFLPVDYFKRENVNYKRMMESFNLIQYFEHWNTTLSKYRSLTEVAFRQQNFLSP